MGTCTSEWALIIGALIFGRILVRFTEIKGIHYSIPIAVYTTVPLEIGVIDVGSQISAVIGAL